MTCLIDSRVGNAPAVTAPITAVSDERKYYGEKVTNASQVAVKERSILSVNLKPEQYIAFQLSYISEQRGVYLYLEDGVFYITVYVDNRDLDLNRRIFEQERSMISFYRHQYKFDLSIIPLQNRQLAEMGPKGMKVL
jgi:hypothetical protein